jgi:uncharacterized protein YndB with AHSA1/START domain
MRPVTAKITIDAPREQVFEIISDLAYRPAFCDHFAKEFRLQRLDSKGVGAAARFRAEAKRFPIWMETVIAEVDAPHRLIEEGKGARWDRMKIGTAWELVEGPGSTTEVAVTFWADAESHSDVAKSKLGASRWYEKQWKKALKRLRDKLEAGEPFEPLVVAGGSRVGF